MIKFRIKEDKKHEYIKNIHSVIFEHIGNKDELLVGGDKYFIKLKGFFSFDWDGDLERWHTVSLLKKDLEIVEIDSRPLEEWL